MTTSAMGRPPRDFQPVNDFQRWAHQRMAALGLSAVSDVAALAKLRNDTVWKVLRNSKNRFPTLETAMALGQALSDPNGALVALENSRNGVMGDTDVSAGLIDDEALVASLLRQPTDRKKIIQAMIDSWEAK